MTQNPNLPNPGILYHPNGQPLIGAGAPNHNHGPQLDPVKEQLRDELARQREHYAQMMIDNGALEQGGFIRGAVKHFRSENNDLGDAYDDYLNTITRFIAYDFDNHQGLQAQLAHNHRGMTMDEVTDAQEQGEPDEYLTTAVGREWESLMDSLKRRLPEKRRVFSRASLQVAGIGAVGGLIDAVGHFGVAKETGVVILTGATAFATAKTSPTKDSINNSNPTGDSVSDFDPKGKVMGQLRELDFENPDRLGQHQSVSIWKEHSNIKDGRFRRKAVREESLIIDDLLEELANPNGRSRDELRVETTVKLMNLRLREALAVGLKNERAIRSGLGRAAAAGALAGVLAFTGYTLQENHKQEQQNEQIEQDNQDYIDHLPPEENGVPDEDPSSFEDLYDKAKQENN